MSLLKKYFDKKSCHSSPIIEDKQRIVKYDDKGNEFITFEPIDYPKFVLSLGYSEDWSLNNLLSSGISPNFPIHTGFGTRLEGVGVVQHASKVAESLFDESNVDVTNVESSETA